MHSRQSVYEKYFRKQFVDLYPLAASVYEGKQGDIQGVSG
jgi:hypothetical protein